MVNIAAGDLGPAAAKKFDIEVWLPSEGTLPRGARAARTTATSRPAGSGPGSAATPGTELVHTLNGTACAISRTLVYLFEHYQQADGSFAVPDVLRPYTGFATVPAR